MSWTYTIEAERREGPGKLLLRGSEPVKNDKRGKVDVSGPDQVPGRQRWVVMRTSDGTYHMYLESPGHFMLGCCKGTVYVGVFLVNGEADQRWAVEECKGGGHRISVAGCKRDDRWLSWKGDGDKYTVYLSDEDAASIWKLRDVIHPGVHHAEEVVKSLPGVKRAEEVARRAVFARVWSRLGEVLQPGPAPGEREPGDVEAPRMVGRHIDVNARRLVDMWSAKPGSIADELCGALRVPQQRDARLAEDASKAFLLVCAVRLREMFGGWSPFLAQSSYLSLLSMRLYTQQEVDIDRFMLFAEVPAFPTGPEQQTLSGREEAYRAYRSYLQDRRWIRRGWLRNPSMFAEANAAFRSLDSESPTEDELDSVAKYVKWVCLLHASRETFQKPGITTTRGLCKVKEADAESLLRKEGKLIVWPALTSTTIDESISKQYAEQIAPGPGKRNLLFHIEGITEGIHLASISQYPDEKEFLLPLFSVLAVKKVVRGELPVIHCEFQGSRLPAIDPGFDQRCLEEAEQAWDLMLEEAAGVADRP